MKVRELQQARQFEDQLTALLTGQVDNNYIAATSSTFGDEFSADMALALDLHKFAEKIPVPNDLYTHKKDRLITKLSSDTRNSLPIAIQAILRFGWLRTALTVFILLVLFTITGVAYAAESSLPGDAIYPVKLAMEDWQLAVLRGQNSKSNLYIEIADKRFKELERLSERGDYQFLQTGLSGYETALQYAIAELEIRSEIDAEKAQLAEKLRGKLVVHIQKLETLREKLPPSAQKGINQALMVSTHGLTVAQYAVQGYTPTPGYKPIMPTKTQTKTSSPTPSKTLNPNQSKTDEGIPGNSQSTLHVPTKNVSVTKTPGPPEKTPPALGLDKTKEPKPTLPNPKDDPKPTKTPRK